MKLTFGIQRWGSYQRIFKYNKPHLITSQFMLFFHIIFTILLVNYVNCFIYQLNQRRDFLFNHLKSPEINTISTHSDVFSPGNDQIYANPTVESQTNSHNLNTLQGNLHTKQLFNYLIIKII